jgi:hypothetical protein
MELPTSHTATQQQLLLAANVSGKMISMKHVPKENTDDALIQEFLNKGGKISVGKTKPMKPELGISKNVWNNVLTKEEKAARDKK